MVTHPQAPDNEPRLIGPASWHRSLARLTGELSLCIGRRKATRKQIDDWMMILDNVKMDMQGFLSKEGK